MAFFKFRTRGQQGNEGRSAPAAVPAESVETMRRRARHRLVGAAVLVLLGVIGFPLLFDTQPRPVSVDIPIEIPDRNKVKPLPVPATPTTPAAPTGAADSGARVAAAPSSGGMITETADGREIDPSKPAASTPAAETRPAAEPKPERKPEPKPEPKPERKPEPKPETKPEPKPKPEAKPETKPAAPKPASAEDGNRARALLEGKPSNTSTKPAASEDGGRFVVQVGAFADADKAREVRQKLEKAGLKTYVNVAKTADGEQRTRVRVGPFSSRAEADKAAEKVKGLSLSAAILTL
ncbi:DedD protein [Variovorax paradoxus]|uniref:SPOR domain-containing protein n=1 Tax=Variovorax paradoxus TaxID=34073 RepID=UPI0027920F7F|nr:SPOR domain-containing protein [Variovorax paradoxus]MDQ0569013.1 DedD protein [Variovorax paradoxus]